MINKFAYVFNLFSLIKVSFQLPLSVSSFAVRKGVFIQPDIHRVKLME